VSAAAQGSPSFSTANRVHFVPPLDAQEQQRADCYATLSRLFLASPDQQLLLALSASVPALKANASTANFSSEATSEIPSQLADDDSAPSDSLGDAWVQLGIAARAFAGAAEPGSIALKAEFDQTFYGVGKAAVFLFGSHYLSGFLHERPLVDLRDDLNKLGLARTEQAGVTEDHIGALCEVMRHLILNNDLSVASLQVQQDFFSTHIAPWYERMADAIESAPSTDFYKHVGRFAKAFFDVERQSFDFEL
jgi:TorA maturation chaperone TorD